MKANVNKAASDAFECKSEIYQCLRNSIHSASKRRKDHFNFLLSFLRLVA